MRFSAPFGIVALLAAIASHVAGHGQRWTLTGAFLGLAVVACFVGLIRLTRAKGELPRQELIELGALLIGLMAVVAGIMSMYLTALSQAS
jgi:hypothetical protein